MNNQEQTGTDLAQEQGLNEAKCNPISDLLEIEPEKLADVAGGPDGSAMGIA